jgi:hypothetical protein
MISISSCAKCGAVICACGFAVTLAVSVFGDGKPPPSRVVGPIVAQLPGSMIPTIPFVEVADQVTGKMYSAAWLEKAKQRERVYERIWGQGGCPINPKILCWG